MLPWNDEAVSYDLGGQFYLLQLLLKSECNPLDPLCIENSTHTAWPIEQGTLQDGIFRVEAFGAQIGHGLATLEIEKVSHDYLRSISDSAQVRLDRETIVVPVHVVVENIRGADFMDSFKDPNMYRALFDDGFGEPTKTFTVSHPAEGFDVHTFGFSQNPGRSQTSDLLLPGSWAGQARLGGAFAEMRPDDVWVQCGIQFRLMSVTVLTVDTPAISYVDDRVSVSLDNAVAAMANRALGTAAEPGDSAQVVFGDHSVPGAWIAMMSHVAPGDSARGRTAGVVAGISASGQNSSVNGVVAHELGHVLGVNGLDDGHISCPWGTELQLMCSMNASDPNLGGCDAWREGIERKEQLEICIVEPCPPVTIDLPLHCNPNANVGLTPVCETARLKAGGFAKTLSGNISPSVTLVDEDGLPLESSVGCESTMNVKRIITTQEGDPFSDTAFRLSGWRVTYGDAETLEYPGLQLEIPVDLSLHLDKELSVTYTAVDIQGAFATTTKTFVRADRDPPEFVARPAPIVEVCSPDQSEVILPFPEVVEACAEPWLSGNIVAADGAPLVEPLPISASEPMELRPGIFEVTWSARNQSGLVTQLTEEIEVVLVQDTSCAAPFQHIFPPPSAPGYVVDTASDAKFLLATSLGDFVLFGAGNDDIFGADGADHLNGGGGEDQIFGGAG